MAKICAFSVESEFQGGHYERVVAHTMDRLKSRLLRAELHWVIGALSFLGRIDEAKELFFRFERSFRVEQRIAARFFLAVTITRHGGYAEGSALFEKNLREGRRTKSAFAKYFVEQGIGFYRYFSGRPKIAAVRAGAAHAHAMDSDFLYGRVLALDLQGHAEIESGEIAFGLELLERARKLARRIGNGSVVRSLENSVLLYQAQFGLHGTDSIARLERKLTDLLPEDTYTESSLLLELGRQYLLRGEGRRAKTCLQRASRVIFSTRNRRHEIILNLRFAALLNREGDPEQALNYLRSARSLLHAGIDRGLEIELVELELRTSRYLRWGDRVLTLEKEAARLLSTATGSTSERALRRACSFETSGPASKRGMDLFGDLMDRWRHRSEESIVECVESGYWGSLPDLLGLPFAFSGVVLDALPQTAIFLDHGNVVVRKGVSRQMRKLIGALARRDYTKAELIATIWGYEYHPLRHDTLVYQAMNQLRRLFGEYSEWIVNRGEAYGFGRNVRVVLQEKTGEDSPPARPLPIALTGEEDRRVSLNLRQRKILAIARRREAIDVRSLVRELGILPLMASRDLAFLSGAGFLVRIGRGRATQYVVAGDA